MHILHNLSKEANANLRGRGYSVSLKSFSEPARTIRLKNAIIAQHNVAATLLHEDGQATLMCSPAGEVSSASVCLNNTDEAVSISVMHDHLLIPAANPVRLHVSKLAFLDVIGNGVQ